MPTRYDSVLSTPGSLLQQTFFLDGTLGRPLGSLLIRALGLENNYAKMRFPGAGAWTQVRLDDVDTYLEATRSFLSASGAT